MESSKLVTVLARQGEEILSEWLREQAATVRRRGLMKDTEVREEASELLRLLRAAVQADATGDLDAPGWREMRELLGRMSRMRGELGFNPSETATFVLSFKSPLFRRLREAHGPDAGALADDIWAATLLLDRLAVHTTEVHQKAREELIARQQEEMLELSTPVVKLWDGILAVPLIGTLDSNRTQIVMESLLTKIAETGSEVAIIDITGVPTVDTLVAQHILKTVRALKLMGASCIISGIRPQIAQTVVHLGVQLEDVVTKASLADAFALALRRVRATVEPPAGR